LKNKILVFAMSLLLILSCLTIAVQGYNGTIERKENNTQSNQDVDDRGDPNRSLRNNNIYSEKEQDDYNRREYCQNSVLVQIEPSTENLLRKTDSEKILQTQVNDLLNLVQGSTYRLYPSFNMAEIVFDEGTDVMNAVELLSRREEVVHAEPNYQIEAANIPNDPYYDSLWAMDKIDAPKAWDITTGSEEVVVAVIDSGIDYNHPDLKDNMWTSDEGYHGYDAVNDTYDPMDDNGHGTHVAGTIGAVGDNDLGVVGVNWNISLMSIKILDSEGEGNIGNAIAALEYSLERKRDGENIVATSNSWGGSGYSELLYEAIERHQEEDILFVTAAGNEGLSNGETPHYPANYDLTNIISVAATDQNDNLAGFSNYGKRSVHVGAPGVDIYSTLPNGQYGHMSGTSMAVPHVSGLAALIASHDSSYDHTNLKNIILSSVDHLDSLQGQTLVGGRINAFNSLEQSPDPYNIRFWVHKPFTSTQWGEQTSIMISLNDGVNPVHGAEVRVEFSTGDDPISLEDDGSRGDQAGDGYYTGEWRPTDVGEVELYITVELEENEEMSKTITVNVRRVHPETVQRVIRGIFSILRNLIGLFRDLIGNLLVEPNLSFESTYQNRKCFPVK